MCPSGKLHLELSHPVQSSGRWVRDEPNRGQVRKPDQLRRARCDGWKVLSDDGVVDRTLAAIVADREFHRHRIRGSGQVGAVSGGLEPKRLPQGV